MQSNIDISTIQATMSGLQREITALKEQFSLKKDSELAVLEQEKRELTSKLTGMQTSIGEQESILSRLQQEYGQSQLEVEQMTGKMERLSQELQVKEREIDSLQGVVKSGSRDKERAASDLASVLKELEEKNRLIVELKRGLGDIKDVLKERESELASQKDLVRVASDREAKLRQHCGELEQRHSQEVEQIKVQLAVAEKAQTARLETAASGTESQEGYSRLQKEVTELHKVKQEMAQVLSEREKLLKQREGEIGDLSVKLDASASELQQARAEGLRVSAEKEMLNQQRNALQAEMTNLSQVKGQLESKVQSLEGSGGALGRLGEELQRKLEAKEQECAKYIKQLANLKAHLIEVGTHTHTHTLIHTPIHTHTIQVLC
jgi:chromosome segregation ATPase